MLPSNVSIFNVFIIPTNVEKLIMNIIMFKGMLLYTPPKKYRQIKYMMFVNDSITSNIFL